MVGQRYSHTLLMGMQTGTDTFMEGNVVAPVKTQNAHIL